MSNYITANINSTFSNKKELEIAILKLEQAGILKKQDDFYYLSDESGKVCTVLGSVVDFDNLKIIFNMYYIRNGWEIVQYLIKVANVNGRVVSSDGNYEFINIVDNKVERIDTEFIKKNNNIKKFSLNEADTENYFYQMEKLLMDWCEDF